MADESYAEILTAKFVTMATLFGVSMIFGCLPMLISMKYDWFKVPEGGNSDLRSSNKFVMGLLAFGGGILFATCFLHLLPEVHENILILQESGQMGETRVYLAAMIMCCGFFMMYFIEESVHVYINKRQKRNNDTNFTNVLNVKRMSNEDENQVPVVSIDRQKAVEIQSVKPTEQSHINLVNEASNGHDPFASAIRGLLIVLALSIHELFEGIAVGLESSVGNVWYMFAAVSAHKYIIAFCVGIELLVAKTSKWLSICYIFTFSFVSALGIGVGIALVGGAGAAEAGLYSVVLQGIASGTLVYVVFFEIWKHDNSGFLQFFSSLLGFAVITTMEALFD